MKRLPKVQRQALAEKLAAYIRDHDIRVTLDGPWLMMNPPEKIPPQMMMECAMCSDELSSMLIISKN